MDSKKDRNSFLGRFTNYVTPPKETIRPTWNRRDYFAITALQGMLSNPTNEMPMPHKVQRAVGVADALIAELKNRKVGSGND